MASYEVEWPYGKEEVDLPVPGRGGRGNRQEIGFERLEGLRERADEGDRAPEGTETRNGSR